MVIILSSYNHCYNHLSPKIVLFFFFFSPVCSYPFNSDDYGTIHLAILEATTADCFVLCQEEKQLAINRALPKPFFLLDAALILHCFMYFTGNTFLPP